MISTPVGAVVMEPAYSRTRRIVSVVPIFDATLYTFGVGDVVFDADFGDDWLTVFGMRQAFAAVGDVFGAPWSSRISRPLQVWVPKPAMERIDTALLAHFGLAERQPAE
jgi:hypothetical protein